MIVRASGQIEDIRIIIGKPEPFLRIDKIIPYIQAHTEMICRRILFFEKDSFVFLGKLRHTFFCHRLQKKRGVLIINVFYFHIDLLKTKKCANRSRRTKTQTPLSPNKLKIKRAFKHSSHLWNLHFIKIMVRLSVTKKGIIILPVKYLYLVCLALLLYHILFIL